MKGALSFLAGALFSFLNYLFTQWSVKKWASGAEQGRSGYGLFFVFKNILLLGLLGLIVLKTPVHVAAFVAGFLTVLFIFVFRRLMVR